MFAIYPALFTYLLRVCIKFDSVYLGVVYYPKVYFGVM